MRFAGEGAKVAVVGRNPDRLEEVKREIELGGGRCITIKTDLSKISNIEMIVQRTTEVFGGLDILVNSAGVFEIADFHDITENFFDKTVSLNTKAAFFMAQKASEVMKKQGKGKIINIASYAGGKVGFPQGSVYCLSKAALVAMTQALAVELGPSQINVNAISPGTVLTPINEKIIEEDASFLKAEIEGTPLGRVGKTSDISSTALFLASDESDIITGIQIVADGGFSAQ